MLDVFKEKMEALAGALQLTDMEAGAGERLQRYREYLEQAHERISEHHSNGEGGLWVVKSRSIAIDVLIQNLYKHARLVLLKELGGQCAPVSLLALGGYGRAEMCPFSDVDLMFLYPDKVRSASFPEMQRLINDTILYMLWDLNLKVGHSTRNLKDALEEAAADGQSKNAMLEARLICGDPKLYERFQKNFTKFIRKDNVQVYLRERLKDQQSRRAKHGNTVFLQEPDIKSGVGGLRDYQNMVWMTRLQYDGRDIDYLVDLQLLRRSEVDDLKKAYDFLLRVRNELHFQSKRATDLLDIERQPKIAWSLGYTQKNIFPRVEAFMRDYYSATFKIYHLSSYLEKRMSLNAQTSITFSSVIRSRRLGKTERFDGFVVQDNTLSAESRKVFIEDPLRLIRVFRHLQSRELDLDFDLERLVVESLDLIDDKVIKSTEANRSFRSILQTKGNVYPTLELMNVTGVLPRFMPEWAGLHCLVQHEYYHRYSADEHILKTIRELDGIFSGEEPETTRKYRQALEETELPGLLYLILLLHDIGKSRDIEDHAQIGAEIAAPILERMQVVEKAKNKILFLIRNHLEMARIWQHYDLNDRRTGKMFAGLIRNGEDLRYLYALTYCDARGTSRSLWNGFKDGLHHQLYKLTLEYLQTPTHTPPVFPMISPETILNSECNLPQEEVEAHFNLLPDRYFSYHNEKEILLHLQMIHKLLRNIATADSLGSLIPIIEWENDLNLGLTVVHVVTWDRAGLFYKLAGALTLSGLSIVSSKALSRSDHITIDTFYVSEPDGGIVESEEALNSFSEHLQNALIHGKNLLPEINAMAEAFKRPSYLRTNITLPTPIPPRVDVYHELSLRRTIIEVEANDELGLLYKLSRTISKCDFDITFARISTEKNVAVDTFYIEPSKPESEEEIAQNLVELKSKLLEVVSPSDSVGSPD